MTRPRCPGSGTPPEDTLGEWGRCPVCRFCFKLRAGKLRFHVKKERSKENL